MSPSACGTLNFRSKLSPVNRARAGGWWACGVTQQAGTRTQSGHPDAKPPIQTFGLNFFKKKSSHNLASFSCIPWASKVLIRAISPNVFTSVIVSSKVSFLVSTFCVACRTNFSTGRAVGSFAPVINDYGCQIKSLLGGRPSLFSLEPDFAILLARTKATPSFE